LKPPQLDWQLIISPQLQSALTATAAVSVRTMVENFIVFGNV
jgi:hypothetical protein